VSEINDAVVAASSLQAVDANSIRVYARVRADVPVFSQHPETGQLVPVGWVKTRDTIPFETEHLKEDEMDQLRYLLANKHLLDGC
ncbi:MAG: hypothetical protein AAFV88_25670, partial [Planctomycetota bacterium]